MKKLFVAALLLTSVASAMGADRQTRFDFQISDARTMDVYPSTYVHPLVADVVVNTQKGRIRDTWTLTPGEFISRRIDGDDAATLQNLRAYGLYKSSEKHNCDLIVAAMFDIKITDQGVVINLVGYPANFANWKSAVAADYNWIEIERGDKKVEL